LVLGFPYSNFENILAELKNLKLDFDINFIDRSLNEKDFKQILKNKTVKKIFNNLISRLFVKKSKYWIDIKNLSNINENLFSLKNVCFIILNIFKTNLELDLNLDT